MDARARFRASLDAVMALGWVSYRKTWQRRGIWMWSLSVLLYVGFLILVIVFLDDAGNKPLAQKYEEARDMFSGMLLFMIFLAAGLFNGSTMVADDIKEKTLYPLLTKPLGFIEIMAGKLLGGALFVATITAGLVVMFSSFEIAVYGYPLWQAWPGYMAVFTGSVCMLALGALAEQVSDKLGGMTVFFMLIFVGSESKFSSLPEWARQAIFTLKEISDWILPQTETFMRVLPDAYKKAIDWSGFAWLLLYAAAYVALFGWMAAWTFGKKGRFRAA